MNAGSSVWGVPSAPQLLEAVIEFLRADVAGSVPADRRYEVLVAANVCEIVRREIEAGEKPLGRDVRLFSELLAEPAPESATSALAATALSATLQERIRSGQYDDRLEALAARLLEHVRRKLAVGRPGYDA